MDLGGSIPSSFSKNTSLSEMFRSRKVTLEKFGPEYRAKLRAELKIKRERQKAEEQRAKFKEQEAEKGKTFDVAGTTEAGASMRAHTKQAGILSQTHTLLPTKKTKSIL